MDRRRFGSSPSDRTERLSAWTESGETDRLDELLTGLDQLSDASGGMSGTQYAEEALRQMRLNGIAITPYTTSMVMRRAFGDPAELLSRMLYKTPDELDEMLPGEIGDAAISYLKLDQL